MGVLDAAIITLMITMMCHLSCRQTANDPHFTPVPGHAGEWGRDAHMRDHWENGTYLSASTYSVSS